MDYLAEIDRIKSKIDELEGDLKSATGQREIAIRNQIIALENTRTACYTAYAQLLPPQNATAGNSHSI